MHALALIIALGLGGAPDGGAADAGTRPALGTHNQVCRFGARRDPAIAGKVARTCGPGLFCCYPCGVQGCDFVCHTKTECQLDSRRP